jgi:hypothetical protein
VAEQVLREDQPHGVRVGAVAPVGGTDQGADRVGGDEVLDIHVGGAGPQQAEGVAQCLVVQHLDIGDQRVIGRDARADGDVVE